MLTLGELLENRDFSCTLAGEKEPSCDFEWDGESMYITDVGYEYFQNVLDSPAEVLSNGNIAVDTSSDPSGQLDDEVCEFVECAAGYCDSDLFDAWFAYR